METKDAKEIAIKFITALNDQRYDDAATYLHPDLKFEGVLGSRNGAGTYINDMRKMKFSYDIKKVVSDEKDVSILFNITMNGTVILTSGWYNISDSKIRYIRVIFDPRALLPPATANK